MIVRPASVEYADGVTVESLSGNDHVTHRYDINCGFIVNALLEENVLEHGLKKCLSYFLVCSGRLDTSKPGEIGIGKFDAGAEIDFITIENEPCPLTPESTELDWQNVEGLFHTTSWETGTAEDPLAKIRVMKFPVSEKTVVSMLWSHGLGDAYCRYLFLRYWSDCCDQLVESSSSKMEAVLPTKPGNRYLDVGSFSAIKTVDELIEQFPGYGKVPLRRLFKPVEYPAPENFKPLEISIAVDDLRKIRDKISIQLEEGEWISSNDVFFALMMAFCGNVNDTAGKEVHVLDTLNLRLGKLEMFPKNYFGNILGSSKSNFIVPKLEEEEGLGWVAPIAQIIRHGRKQNSEETKEAVFNRLQWLNAALKLGLGYELDFVGFQECFDNDTMFLNNVSGFEWFKMAFGSSGRVTVYSDYLLSKLPNYFRLFTRCPGKVIMKIALVGDESKVERLERLIKQFEVPMELNRQYNKKT